MTTYITRLGNGNIAFINGSLGPHCADCTRVATLLCDYPVGEGKTCDRHMCEAHATEIKPQIHYCKGHNERWLEFKASGEIDALRLVVSRRAEEGISGATEPGGEG